MKHCHCRGPGDRNAVQQGEAGFVTYENYRNPHVTIHVAGCGQIAKRGGQQVGGQGKYEQHASLAEAEHYAEKTGLNIVRCFFCEPDNYDARRLGMLLPEELEEVPGHIEGAACSIIVNAYERNRAAREACLAHYGYVCSVCDTRLADVYGSVAEQVIHVHHVKPICEIGEEYEVDLINDLLPVCPNCHAVIHSRMPCYSVAEVRAFFTSHK